MRKSKLLVSLLLGIFIIFSSCEKKSMIDTETGIIKNEIVSTYKNNLAGSFIFKGKNINENDIDYNKENLRIIYGYGKDVYVFYSDDDMYNWAVKHNLNKLSQAVVNIKNAKEKAKIMSPKEFDQWLSDNFNTGEKSGGIGYHGNNFHFPSFYLFPVPKGMVAFQHNDQLSSFKAFVNSYIFFNGFYFEGPAVAYITIGYRQKRKLPAGFNDTMSSYWPF